jgi:hypothetical protein
MARSTTSAADTAETDETTANVGEQSRIADGALPESASLTMPASADRGEAAAIAAAVGAHLHDRAAGAAATDDTPEHCNRWKLRGRLGGREPPREVARGEEWKAAGRARW